MKTTSKLIIFIFTFLAMTASAFAQTPREELQQMVKQLQENSYDRELREKIIKLAQTLKPAPEISEEARRSFIIGEALFKQAKNLRPAYEAAKAFQAATTLAPWWSDAYWNLSAAKQFIGEYDDAKNALRFYLLTNPSAADSRMAQDRLYAIDADIMVSASSVPVGLAGFWQRISYQLKGEWINYVNVFSSTYEIQQTGSTYEIKCLTCYSDDPGTFGAATWSTNVISSNINAITFQIRSVQTFDSGVTTFEYTYECKLGDNKMSCTITSSTPGADGKEFEKEFHRYAKRNVCEIIGGPGIQGNPVLCK